MSKLSKRLDQRLLETVNRRPGIANALKKISKGSRLADSLVSLRKSVGLTQRRLAQIAKWKQPQVARVESLSMTGSSERKIGTIVKYIDACDGIAGLVIVKKNGNDFLLHDIIPLTEGERSECFINLMKVDVDKTLVGQSKDCMPPLETKETKFA